MGQSGNYLKYSSLIGFLIIGMLLLVRMIPAEVLANAGLKRADILADVIPVSKAEQQIATPESANIQLPIDTTIVSEAVLATSLFQIDTVSYADTVRKLNTFTHDSLPVVADTVKKRRTPRPADSLVTPAPANIVAIEDFGGDSYAMEPFFRAIASGGSIRIGVMGDSFIEGDIFTADLREQLQRSYGGRGVGYVPMASQVSGMRPTVKHLHSGWNSHTILTRKSDKTVSKYSIAGTAFTASAAATASFEGTKYRRNLNWFERARMIFLSPNSTEIAIRINDNAPERFKVDGSSMLQCLEVEHDSIHKVSFSVANPEGIISYGAYLDCKDGIYVDNLSLRGNAGTIMNSVSTSLTDDMRNYVDYNLIVLQYGLNVVDANVLYYDSYRKSMAVVVNALKQMYPNAAIVIMGVGDRGTRIDGAFVTMPSIHGMIKAQRALAKECGVAFWNTFEAMGGENSMSKFVEWNWAAKDYTHISFRGGKHIADAMIKALTYSKTLYDGHRDEGGLHD